MNEKLKKVDHVSFTDLFLVRLGDDSEPVHGNGDDGHRGHEGCHTGNRPHKSTNISNIFLKLPSYLLYKFI